MERMLSRRKLWIAANDKCRGCRGNCIRLGGLRIAYPVNIESRGPCMSETDISIVQKFLPSEALMQRFHPQNACPEQARNEVQVRLQIFPQTLPAMLAHFRKLPSCARSLSLARSTRCLSSTSRRPSGAASEDKDEGDVEHDGRPTDPTYEAWLESTGVQYKNARPRNWIGGEVVEFVSSRIELFAY